MRVDLLLIDRKCYTYEAYAVKHVSACFESMQIPYQLIYLSDGSLQEYFSYIAHSSPLWTLSFSNITPQYKPLCDILFLPHFFWLADTFAQATHYLNSTYGKVGVNDPSLCQKIDSSKVVHLPQGVERTTCTHKKMFEVVLFSDLVDLFFLEKTWEELFSPNEIALIKNGIALADPLSAITYFYHIERYLRAQKTIQTVGAFKQVRLDVFGEHAGNNWLVHLPQTVHLHTQLPFTEHFEVLKLSKIAILETESVWYWPAIACGCLPLSADEQVVDYFLTHSLEREKALKNLQIELEEKTWEKQIKKLMKVMY